MQNIKSFSLILILVFSSSFLGAQESSIQTTRSSQSAEASRPTPTPTPDARKRRSVPEVEDAMAKGQDLLFKQHDARASIDEFKRAAKLDPWYGKAYMLLGLAQMQLQKWSDAQWAFEEAGKVEPGNAKAYLGAGSALNEQKNYSEAQKALQHSLEIRPDSAEAHYELARTLWGLGKLQAAEPHVRQAIELNKDYAGPHALMGNIYLQRQDAEAALAEFEECLRLDPEGSFAPSAKEIIAQLKKALGK
ncbi:MAG: Translation elongation factor [Candidatus Angelobacter sp.]|jgi:tetratricopeptide (TPR) repeat protein|nr:Translation elongation factor [Candidatus Angelobacter sp.]